MFTEHCCIPPPITLMVFFFLTIPPMRLFDRVGKDHLDSEGGEIRKAIKKPHALWMVGVGLGWPKKPLMPWMVNSFIKQIFNRFDVIAEAFSCI